MKREDQTLQERNAEVRRDQLDVSERTYQRASDVADVAHAEMVLAKVKWQQAERKAQRQKAANFVERELL